MRKILTIIRREYKENVYKKGFIIYLKLHMPGLYKEIKKHLPENITDWSWKQIAELTN